MSFRKILFFFCLTHSSMAFPQSTPSNVTKFPSSSKPENTVLPVSGIPTTPRSEFHTATGIDRVSALHPKPAENNVEIVTPLAVLQNEKLTSFEDVTKTSSPSPTVTIQDDQITFSEEDVDIDEMTTTEDLLSDGLLQNETYVAADKPVDAILGVSSQSICQKLMAQISLESGIKKNFVFSPLSLQAALAMLASGATPGSETKKELTSALGINELFHDFEKDFTEALKFYATQTPQSVTVANKLWMKETIFKLISENYTEYLKQDYSAEVGSLLSRGSEDIVNDWIKMSTKGKIDKIVDSIDPETVLMLTNAIYFKESWSVPFSKLNQFQSFTLVNGKSVQVSMMQRSSHEILTAKFNITDFGRNEPIQTVTIPYLTSRFRLTVVMPEDPSALPTIFESEQFRNNSRNLFRQVFDKVKIAETQSVERSLEMPPFFVKAKFQMADYLSKLGLNRTFVDAEFSMISEKVPLKVSSVSHAATVEVTVDGTVGAAATGVELIPFFGSFEQPLNVVINKPFIFVINDIEEDLILFAGVVFDPSKEQIKALGKTIV